jgi:RHS repeat-associated protein
MGLTGAAAVALAKQTFHVQQPSWTPPGNEDGGHIIKYLGETSARVELPSKKRLVVSSTMPLRVQGSSGLTPVSLTLQDTGPAYTPANPLVPVAISKTASGGVSFPEGLSVAPVSAEEPEGSTLVGNRVVYTNAAPDTDTMIEPVPGGAEVSWQLRSAQSPESNSLDFKLPPGVSLQYSSTLPGGAEVVAEGKPAMLIPPAVAEGADGEALPVSYAISGNVLTTHVDLSGNVAFPVLVDPLLYGYYGAWNSANVWSNWHHYSNCGCFSFPEYSNLIQAGTNPGPPNNDFGEWYIWAPGAGTEGGAGIARVDVAGATHQALNQSAIQGGIVKGFGPNPVYSLNGLAGATGPSPMNTDEVYSNQSIAFCAQGAGGHDGGEQPLCDENYAGEAFFFADVLGPNSQTVYNYVQMSGASIVYADAVAPNVVKIYNIPSEWVKNGPTNDYIYASDQGLGIQRFELQMPPGNSPTFKQELSCNAPNGFSGCPSAANSENINLAPLGSGVYELGAVGVDAAGNATLQTPHPKLYIDHTGPTIGSFTGSLASANNGVIGDGNYVLNFSAQDGSASAPQIGVESLEVQVDGRQAYTQHTRCSKPSGVPAESCLGLSGNWTMNGQTYGAGSHTVTVIAKDWLGNESKQTLHITVNDAAYQQMGPGSMNLETGDYKLNTTDVSITSGNATLSLSRSYESRNTSQGANGPLGPQWMLSLPDSAANEEWQSLTPLAEGSVSVYDKQSNQIVFTPKSGGGYTSPDGYQTDILTEPSTSPAIYQITDTAGNYTKFAQPSSGGPFVPETVAEATNAGGLNKVTYQFTRTSAGITEPTEVLAPEPTGGACTPTLVNGCRALTFNYATSTTATGESPAGWGDFNGRLTRVSFTAWDPSKAEMTTTAVAQYAYDTQGRLRAEWDPRISPALKTTYGYDSEGHVTALTTPGQEPWIMHYGTAAGDLNTGRLLSAGHPSATTELGSGEAPVNTTAPALSTTTPAMGVSLSVSTGAWSNSPLSYSYQWERCSTSGTECAPIPGATNQTYTPIGSDARSTLAARVTTANADGATSSVTSTSNVLAVPFTTPRYSSAFGSAGTASGQFNGVADVAVAANGNVWAEDYTNNRIEEFSPAGTFLLSAGSGGSGNGQLSAAQGVAVSSVSGNVYVGDTNNNRVEEFSSTGAFVTTFGSLGSGNGQLNGPRGLWVDQSGNVWVADYGNNRIEEFSSSGSYIRQFGSEGTGNGQFKNVSGVTICGGNVYANDVGDQRVEEFSTTGTYLRQFGFSGTGNGQFTQVGRIACDATGQVLYVVDKGGNRVEVFSLTGEFLGAFGSSGSGAGQFNSPVGIAVAANGSVYVGDTVNNRVEAWVPPPLTYTLAFGTSGTGNGQFNNSVDDAVDPSGNVWTADYGNNRIQEFSASGSFVRTAGSAGSGNGQLSGPQGVAVSSVSGNVYVGDTNNNRVEEFSSTGAFVTTFGSLGSGNGQLNGPRGLWVDQSGNVWVADYGNNRIEEFSSSGSYIRQFGSEGTGNGQFKNVSGVTICGGNVYANDVGDQRVEEFSTTGTYLRQFGFSGTGNGQFTQVGRIACDATGQVLYVVDKGGNRVEVFSLTGEFLGAFGSAGSGAAELSGPVGVSVAANGSVYVADNSNNRYQEWTPDGLWQEPAQAAPNPGSSSVWTAEYHVPVLGSEAPYAMGATEVGAWAQKDDPVDATAIFPPDEPQGWPASQYKRARVYYMDSVNHTVNTASPSKAISTTEYASNDNVERTLSPDNRQAAINKGGNTAETAELLDTKDTYSSDGTELVSTLGPQHTVKLANGSEVLARKHTQYSYEEGAPSGGPYHLVTKTTEGAQITGQEEKDIRTVKTSYSGQENLGWKLHAPTSSTVTVGTQNIVTTTGFEPSTGNVTESRTPGGPQEHSSQATYSSQFGSSGTENGQFSHPGDLATDSKGNVWVLDHGNSRIEEFNEKGEYIKVVGAKGSGNGQLSNPDGIAIDAKGNVWVADTGNNRIEEFNEKGEFVRTAGSTGSGSGQFTTPEGIAVDAHNNVWVSDTGNGRLEVFNEKGEYQKTVSSKGSGAGQIGEPEGLAIAPNGNAWVADWSNNRIDEFNEKGEYVTEFGSNGAGNGQFKQPYGITVDASTNVWVADTNNYRVQEFNAKAEYVGQFGTKGTGAGQFSFSYPVGIATDAKGNIWVTDPGNNRVEKWLPPGQSSVTGNEGAHTTQTIYYTAGANPTVPTCGNHPEWSNLPCQGQPAAQPETSGLPNLPVTTYTYNIWDEPVTTVDTVGSTKRTTTITYDNAGRTVTSAISSSVNTPLPTVTDEYNPETGALIKQSSTGEGNTQAIKSTYNRLGQLTAYVDADGNEATYTYDVDGRSKEVNDGKGTQTYGYDPTTGALTSLKDSAAGTFSASYDAEGNMTTEGYPNGMNANYTYNSLGQPTSLEYVKTTHCSSGCTWYTDASVPSVHDQWMSQTSTLSKQTYAYDEIGRLTEVQETPAGKGCTTRLYAYEEDGNRTGLTTREPGSEGKCAPEGGTTQRYNYDTADRLVETGVSYDTFGNITTLPATDAGGTSLTSTYYVNNTLATQSQNGETIGYNLDPTGRVRETVSTGTTNATVTSHYSGSGDVPAWTATMSGSWTRNITGISGGLAAIQSNGEAPVLQLADLHGDIIGTASVSETESKLQPANEATEYGAPRTNITAKYSWLGSEQLPTELPSGMIGMGARGYIPELGRFEQTDPEPGGSANAYAYTFDDPVNTSDPSGAWTSTTTYNYEAAETGAAQEGVSEHYVVPGAIMPPPVNMQIENEFAANPPWNAASAQAGHETHYGGSGRGLLARFITDPVRGRDPNESECNRSGQGCKGCRSGGKVSHGKCQPGTGGGPSKKTCRIEEISEATGAVIGIFFAPIGAVSAAAGVVTVADCS